MADLDQYQQYVVDRANQYGVDPNFALRIAKQESSFNPSIRDSGAGAIGYMQLMPQTAKSLGVNPRDPFENIDGGVRYLRQMQDQFGNNPSHIAAAYNAGPGRLNYSLRTGAPLPAETQNYVAKTAFANEGSGSDDEPALKAINYAVNKSPTTGSPMADQGALNTKQTLGNGVLGGMGPALQDAGAFLMGTSPYTKMPDTNHSANFLREAGPQVIDGGTDPLTGQKMLFTLRNGQLMPMGIGAAPGAGAPAGPGGAVTYSGSSMPNVSQLTQAIGQHHAGQIDDDQLKKVAGPLLADYTDALARGDADPKNLGNRAGPLRPYAIMLAHALHPDMDFSEGMIDARRREIVNMANSNNVNTLAGAAASFSKVIQHGNEIQDAAERLNKFRMAGGNFNDLNWAQNYLKSHSGDTDFKAALNDYETAADAFSKESDRLMSQGHPTLTGQQEIRSRFNSDKSLPEISKATGRVLSLSHDVFEPLTYNNNYAFGRLGKPTEKKPEEFMSPATRKAWNDAQERITKATHQGGTSGGPEVRYGPDGRAYVQGPNGPVPYKP